jgi:hypothetical protein
MHPFRNSDNAGTVEEGQFRLGTRGLIRILSVAHKVRDEPIHYGNQDPPVFSVSIIIRADNDRKWSETLSSERWEYHSTASIKERWPVVLRDDWLELLLRSGG